MDPQISDVRDTLLAANTYLKNLHSLDEKVKIAKEQICTTSLNTEKQIEDTFNEILIQVTKALTNRRNLLIDKVRETKTISLAPLDECQIIIANKINKTNSLIDQGTQYLKSGDSKTAKEFIENSSLLGTLPEIPELGDVPFLSFQIERPAEPELLDICSNLGQVSRIAPVQISQILEKPGSLLIEWQNNEEMEDRAMDIDKFRLQKAFGDLLVEKHLISTNFSDCYIGVDSQFLVKDLIVGQVYSFRVCCQFEGSNVWSPWSLIQTASTSKAAFTWKLNADYALADNNRIATPLKDSPMILISSGSKFTIGDSVELTFLEYDQTFCTVGLIALSGKFNEITEFSSHKHFTLNSNGQVFVDGVEKSTKLAKATKGLKVCFTCEFCNSSKVRIHVDCAEKRVTYDWGITQSENLFIFADLKTPKTKVMIE